MTAAAHAFEFHLSPADFFYYTNKYMNIISLYKYHLTSVPKVFHVCGRRGEKYSFLCPNGTIFQQQYFVCDWWFNVDCSLAESLYSLNDQVDAERQANSGSGGYQEASQAGGRRGSLSSGNEIGGYNPGEGRRRNSRDILREVLQDY